MTDAAQDHLCIADALSSQVVEVLRAEQRSDANAKKVAYFALLKSENPS